MSWSSASELSVSDGSGDLPGAFGQSAGALDVDERLIEGLRRGESSAAEAFVARYGAVAYRLAIGILRNPRDAEDVVDDAFSTAMARIDTLDHEVSMRAWLYGIVTEAAFRRRRHVVRRPTGIHLDDVMPAFHEDSEQPSAIDDWTPRLDDPAIQTEVHWALGSAFDELTLDDRAVVFLRDVEDLPIADVATVLAIGVADARSRLHRARLLLRDRLARVMTISP